MERVHAAGEEIVRVSVAAGGVLSGEHGIGLEKRDLMPLLFGPVDLDLQARLREAFDPDGLANPRQGAARRQPLRRPPAGPGGRVDLTAFAAEVGPAGPVTCVGARRQWDVGGPVAPGTREVKAPAGIDWIAPEEMTVACGAGTTVAELDAALAERGQLVAPAGLGHGRRRAGGRPQRHPPPRLRARCATPCSRRGVVTADGVVAKAGGPTVKNVSGFDLCRLLVGSLRHARLPR